MVKLILNVHTPMFTWIFGVHAEQAFASWQVQIESTCSRVLYRIFRKGGGDHLMPPTYQGTVPMTNALTARICLWKKILGVFE